MVTPRLIGAIVLIGALFCATLLLPVSRIASIFCYPFIVMQSYLVDPIKRHITEQRTSYQELQNAYDDLMQQHLRLQALADFEREARDMIAFSARYDAAHYAIAQVIERHIADDAHYLLLDKGSRDGIQLDAAVVHKDMLVGNITDVYPLYARCRLITDPTCKVGAYIADSQVVGVTQGAGAGALQLLHVSHLQKVPVGALLITSGSGLVYPRGFGVGSIRSVEPDGLTLKIFCRPLLDFGQITYCAILMRP